VLSEFLITLEYLILVSFKFDPIVYFPLGELRMIQAGPECQTPLKLVWLKVHKF
jgi:hypothetical protein